jgi:hypothetical protein
MSLCKKLPLPIQRYLEHCGINIHDIDYTTTSTAATTPPTLPHSISFTQPGIFHLSPHSSPLTFSSQQRLIATSSIQSNEWIALCEIYHSSTPTLQWMNSLIYSTLWYHITDTYHNGKGTLQVKLNNMIPLSRDTGGENPRLNQGSALRYYMEAIIWLPHTAITVLYKNGFIEFESIDENHCNMICKYGTERDICSLTFNDQHELIKVCGMRYMASSIDAGHFTLQHFEGQCDDYRVVKQSNGVEMKIAHHVTASWKLDTGFFTYFDGRIDNVKYHY